MADDAKNEKVEESCDGPNSLCIKLISSDGQEFIIPREHAFLSGTLKAMLNGPTVYAENETNVVRLREIRGPVLAKVCEYLAYTARYKGSGLKLPPFDVPPEINMEALMAANFLDC
uniref:Elongin-C n=1 Tax=Strigamia maritima TaxID=126957 RepID=T1J336_STRMM